MNLAARWHPAACVGFVLTFQAAIVASAQTAPVLAPIAALEIGVAPERVGYFTAVVFAAALVSSNGVAGLMARVGSFMGAAMSLGLAALGLLCLSAAQSFWLPVIGAVLIGIGYGPVNPLGSRLLMQVAAPRRQNLIFSLKQSSVSIGGVLTAMLLPALAIGLGWRGAILATAIFPAIVALVAFPARSALGNDADPQASMRFVGPFRSAMAMLSDPLLRRISLAVVTFSMVQFGFMSVYVTLLWQWPHLAPATAAAMLSLALAASIAGRLFWGWRADGGGAQRILAGLALVGAVDLVAMLFMTPQWPLAMTALLSLVLGFGPMGWSGVLLSQVAMLGAARNGPQGILRITAGTMVFGYLGGLAGPALLSLSVALTGTYAGGVAIMAASMALSAAVMFRGTMDNTEADA